MGKRQRTWKVLEWRSAPKEIAEWIPLDCPCGYGASCPASIHVPILSVIGMSIIFDPPGYEPPDNYVPNIIKCRKCGRIYS